MITLRDEWGIDSINALNNVLKNETKVLSRDSEKNIADNLVSIVGTYKEKSMTAISDPYLNGNGTGLMLTTDGFVLTAYHVVEKFFQVWQKHNEKYAPPNKKNLKEWLLDIAPHYHIKTKDGKMYPIDITYGVANHHYDLALIKVVTPKKPESIEFNIAKEDLKKGDGITLLGRKNEQQYNQLGVVLDTDVGPKTVLANNEQSYINIADSFETSAFGTPGFSGGVFTTLDGQFAGVTSYINKPRNKTIGKSCGIKISDIKDFLGSAIKDLNYKVKE